jgi:hypothetical protein
VETSVVAAGFCFLVLLGRGSKKSMTRRFIRCVRSKLPSSRHWGGLSSTKMSRTYLFLRRICSQRKFVETSWLSKRRTVRRTLPTTSLDVIHINPDVRDFLAGRSFGWPSTPHHDFCFFLPILGGSCCCYYFLTPLQPNVNVF